MTWGAAPPMAGIAIGWVAPDAVDLVLFAFGWAAGWFLLWRLRPLPAAVPRPRRPLAIVIPARDEAPALQHLLPPLVAQLAPDDELVVVDDDSGDRTAEIAESLGARVVAAPPLPDGWLGKPHACWHGAANTSAPDLLFLDADVRPPVDLLARVSRAIDADRDAIVSVQPWHSTERPAEQVSLLFNVVSLMGSGAFTALGPRAGATVAFGPVLAVDRGVYEGIGGHANPTTRRMHTEDIGLARAAGRAALHTGAPDIAFRMYPAGLRQAVDGWTRTIATGARFAPWWTTVLVLAWIASLAGGWLAAPVVYPLSAIQVWVLGRRAGSMHPATAVLFPLAVLLLVAVFVRSLVTRATNRQVGWKGRRVDPRPAD